MATEARASYHSSGDEDNTRARADSHPAPVGLRAAEDRRYYLDAIVATRRMFAMTVGVRDLKQRTSDVLRRVRERGEAVDVTFRGRVIARLVPVTRTDVRARRGQAV